MSVWQPIETAPTKRGEVDLWTAIGRVPDCKWRTGEDGTGWYTRGDKGWVSLKSCDLKATHWMPLPAAPAIAAAMGEV